MHTTTMRMHHLARNLFVPGCHATRIDPTHVQSERGGKCIPHSRLSGTVVLISAYHQTESTDAVKGRAELIIHHLPPWTITGACNVESRVCEVTPSSTQIRWIYLCCNLT